MTGTLLTYSLLASTLLIVVWTVYKCFLANLGSFRFNRIFLLFCVDLSFILPLFILNPFWVGNMVTENMDISLDPIEIAYIADTVSEKIIPIWDYIVTLYLVGSIAMMLYFLVSMIRLALFIFKGERIKQEDCRIILHRHNNVAPFAWCGYMLEQGSQLFPTVSITVHLKNV